MNWYQVTYTRNKEKKKKKTDIFPSPRSIFITAYKRIREHNAQNRRGPFAADVKHLCNRLSANNAICIRRLRIPAPSREANHADNDTPFDSRSRLLEIFGRGEEQLETVNHPTLNEYERFDHIRTTDLRQLE